MKCWKSPTRGRNTRMESLWQSHKTLGRAVAHKRLIVSILPKTPCRQKGARSEREAIDCQHVMRHKNQYP